MSLISKLFSTSETVTKRIDELVLKRSQLETQLVEADGQIALEIVQNGSSRSDKIAAGLHREIASIDRAITALQSERAAFASQEEELRTSKAWQVADDFGRHLANRGSAIEGLIGQLRVAMAAVLADAGKLREMVPELPEGFRDATPLESGLLAATRDGLHGSNFREHAGGVSASMLISEYVALCLREKPDPLHVGTQRLLKSNASGATP